MDSSARFSSSTYLRKLKQISCGRNNPSNQFDRVRQAGNKPYENFDWTPHLQKFVKWFFEGMCFIGWCSTFITLPNGQLGNKYFQVLARPPFSSSYKLIISTTVGMSIVHVLGCQINWSSSNKCDLIHECNLPFISVRMIHKGQFSLVIGMYDVSKHNASRRGTQRKLCHWTTSLIEGGRERTVKNNANLSLYSYSTLVSNDIRSMQMNILSKEVYKHDTSIEVRQSYLQPATLYESGPAPRKGPPSGTERSIDALCWSWRDSCAFALWVSFQLVLSFKCDYLLIVI